MPVELATPAAGAVAALVVVPLAVLVLVAGRARRVRAFLGVPHPGGAPLVAAALATCAVAVLVGAAAAQPVITSKRPAPVRSDAEVLFVIDTSRSMLARGAPSARTRLDRAREAAVRLRSELPTVPVGLASLTDRLLPHAFPTADAGVFRHTLTRSIGVGRPPPADFESRATIYYPLIHAVRGNLLRSELQRRAMVVLTDGEARQTDVGELRAAFERAEPLTLTFVRFWQPDELVYDADGSLEDYRPDPASGRTLEAFAGELGADVYAEDSLGQAASSLRRAIGEGPVTDAGAHGRPRPLAPYFPGAAFLPLLFLLWTRNRA